MKLFRRIIAVVLAVSGMSLCTVPSRGNDYGSTGVRATSEAINIDDQALSMNGAYYTNYYTELSPSSSGSNYVYYNTFCVDIAHDATTAWSELATATPPFTSSYSGGSAINPSTIGDTALGYAAWLANTYSASATSPDQQAGLQIAIWKILYEKTTAFSSYASYTPSGAAAALGGGSAQFTATSAGPGTGANVIADAYGYIMDWITNGEKSSSAYLVNYAGSDSGSGVHPQYQLIADPVPEPSTMAIACLGVLGFAGYGLTRSRRRA